MEKKQINIIGSALGCSGYDIHTRELANVLNELVPVRLSTNLYPGCELTLNDKELEMIKRKPIDNEINLIITVPHQWKLHTTHNRNWAYCVWEGDKVPDSFLEDFSNPQIEYIIVPSLHTYYAIKKMVEEVDPDAWYGIGDESYKNKLRIIPHGVDLKKFYSQQKSPSSAYTSEVDGGYPPAETFTFLCNKGFRNLEDRGGVQYTIKAYLEEFTPEDNVNLLLKINPAYGIPDLNSLIKQLSPKDKELPKITIIADNIPYENLVNLYNQCDVFVSSTRCEGYNIPCIEAMACSKPVITTNFGGQTDFCNDENGWIIGGELEEVKHEVIYEGTKWLTPDIKELCAKMREAYKSKDLQSKIDCAKQTAKKNTWKHTAKKIYNLI